MEEKPDIRLAEERNQGLAGNALGRYRIVERLGSDGPVSTYRAESVSLSRVVVLKVLAPCGGGDPSAADLFLSAARRVAAIDHPNIGAIYEIGESGGHVFFARAGCVRKHAAVEDAAGPDIDGCGARHCGPDCTRIGRRPRQGGRARHVSPPRP